MGDNTLSSTLSLTLGVGLNRRHCATMQTAKSNLHHLSAKKTDLAPTSVEIGLPSSQAFLHLPPDSRQPPMMVAPRTLVGEKHSSMSGQTDLRMPAHIAVMVMRYLRAGVDSIRLQLHPLGEGGILILSHMGDGHKTEQVLQRLKPSGG